MLKCYLWHLYGEHSNVSFDICVPNNPWFMVAMMTLKIWICLSRVLSVFFCLYCTKPSFCRKNPAFLVLLLLKNYCICAIKQSTSSQQIYTEIFLSSTNIIYEPLWNFFVSFGETWYGTSSVHTRFTRNLLLCNLGESNAYRLILRCTDRQTGIMSRNYNVNYHID